MEGGKPREVPFPMGLPPKPRDAGNFFSYLENMKYENACSPEVQEMMNRLLGGGQQSYSQRTIEMISEDGTQVFRIGAFTSTRVQEVKEIVALIASADIRNLRVMSKQGKYWRSEPDSKQCSSKIKVCGIPNFDRPTHKYQLPICIIGGGYGGITCAIRLLNSGRDNFVVIEKHHDFGGGSWISVANKHTKLQTEKGTYHVRYIHQEAPIPQYMPTWPSRDQLLAMFRKEARGFGLGDKAMFATEVRKVPNPDLTMGGYVRNAKGDYCMNLEHRKYDVHYGAINNVGETKTFEAGAILAWPGNLCFPREVTVVGEDDFGGYIEYGSGGKTDYEQVDGKGTILWGHGAFMIENVRTLMEHQASKVWVMCRKRNLTTPKMVSWLISQTALPAQGLKLLKFFQPMYDLAGFDPWTAHSVSCDSKRTVARIRQKTVFGVTDVYFLACYYKKCEVVIDEIKRLSYHTAHLVKGGVMACEAIVKVVGLQANPATDKYLGVQELVGYWVNGDALRPCCTNGTGVNAQNFGTFSVGPAIAGNTTLVTHFLLYPDDLNVIREQLPICRADEDGPAYSPTGEHFLSTSMVCFGSLPALAMKSGHFDQMKSAKQHIAHPLQKYLEECKNEWEMYIEMFGTDDMPPPPYPYTQEMMEGFIHEIYADKGYE